MNATTSDTRENPGVLATNVRTSQAPSMALAQLMVPTASAAGQ